MSLETAKVNYRIDIIPTYSKMEAEETIRKNLQGWLLYRPQINPQIYCVCLHDDRERFVHEFYEFRRGGVEMLEDNLWNPEEFQKFEPARKELLPCEQEDEQVANVVSEIHVTYTRINAQEQLPVARFDPRMPPRPDSPLCDDCEQVESLSRQKESDTNL
jgi:hypothetical protein